MIVQIRRSRLQVRGAHGRLDDRRGVGDVARPFQPRRKKNRRKHVDVGEISATFCQHFAKLLAFLQTLPIFFFAKLPAVSAPHLVPLMERFPVMLSSEGWASAAAQATAFDHHNYQTWVQIQWSAPCRSGPGLHFWTDSSLTDFRRIATESQKTSSI